MMFLSQFYYTLFHIHWQIYFPWLITHFSSQNQSSYFKNMAVRFHLNDGLLKYQWDDLIKYGKKNHLEFILRNVHIVVYILPGSKQLIIQIFSSVNQLWKYFHLEIQIYSQPIIWQGMWEKRTLTHCCCDRKVLQLS